MSCEPRLIVCEARTIPRSTMYNLVEAAPISIIRTGLVFLSSTARIVLKISISKNLHRDQPCSQYLDTLAMFRYELRQEEYLALEIFLGKFYHLDLLDLLG